MKKGFAGHRSRAALGDHRNKVNTAALRASIAFL